MPPSKAPKVLDYQDTEGADIPNYVRKRLWSVCRAAAALHGEDLHRVCAELGCMHVCTAARRSKG